MSQIYSRINIRVSSPKIWEKFIDEDDACFDLAELANTNETSFVIDSEWSANDRELYGIVDALADTLGADGIIIADLTDINVDPFDYCIYYLGEEVKTKEFSIYEGKSR